MPKRILVIEDEVGYQEVIETFLGATYEVAIVNNAEEGMEKLNSEAFDLVVCDINLLGMSGLEVLNMIHTQQRNETTPVVMCSSQTDDDTRQKVVDLGAAGFVTKPFQIEKLVQVVASLVGE